MEKIELVDSGTITDNYGDLVGGKKKAVISLPVPVMDIRKWFKTRDAYASLLGMTGDELEKLVYYAAHVVIEPGETEMAVGTILSIEEYNAARKKYGDDFSTKTGAVAVKTLLSQMNMKDVCDELRSEEHECLEGLEKFRMKVADEEADEPYVIEDVEQPTESDADEHEEVENEPSEEDILLQRLSDAREKLDCFCFIKEYESHFITEISLFPLELRPMVKDAARKAPYGIYNDLETLYRKVYDKASRLRRLIELDAPEVILFNETRLLQESVDCLLANGMRDTIVKGNERPLFCIRDLLEICVTAV